MTSSSKETIKVSDRGVPILYLPVKLVALAHCIAHGSYEDAAGHLCDLLEWCRTRVKPEPFPDLEAMVKHYGAHPTPIEDFPFTVGKEQEK